MITKEVFEYIQRQHSAGIEKSKIKRDLMSGGGWYENEIDHAFELLKLNTTPAPIQIVVPKKHKSRRWIFWVIFIVVLSLATLYGWREYSALKRAITPRMAPQPLNR